MLDPPPGPVDRVMVGKGVSCGRELAGKYPVYHGLRHDGWIEPLKQEDVAIEYVWRGITAKELRRLANKLDTLTRKASGGDEHE